VCRPFAAVDPEQSALVIGPEGREIALAGPRDRLRRQVVDLFELVPAA
jgi:hypothetical protein